MSKSRKSKAVVHGKRRQKAALKAKQREARRPSTRTPSQPSSTLWRADSPSPTIAPISDEEWRFWAAHGANYILSDYATGIWDPVIDIYSGTPPPSLAGSAKAIADKFGSDAEKWPSDAKAALAWTASSKATVAAFRMEIIRRLDGAVSPAIEPHNPVVWGVFDLVRKKVAATST